MDDHTRVNYRGQPCGEVLSHNCDGAVTSNAFKIPRLCTAGGARQRLSL